MKPEKYKDPGKKQNIIIREIEEKERKQNK